MSMLLRIRQEKSKRPKRWDFKSVYELKCDHCGIEFEKSYTNNKVLTSKHFCSRKCKSASQSSGLMSQIVQNPFSKEEVKEKIRQTNLERYGVESPSTLDIFKQKAAATWFEKYGVTAPMKSEAIRQKSRETCIERYGVPNVSQSEDIQQKIANTNVARYGHSSPFVFSAEKIKQTILDRHGVDNPMRSEVIKHGMLERCREKYGVDHPMQVKSIHEKAYQNSVSRHETGHLETPWGIHWYRSSWEKRFLEWCVETQTEILDGNIGIPYVHNGKNRIYYADFLVLHSGRRILCEIKPAKLASLEINRLKFDAAKKWCDANNSIFVHVDESVLLNLSEHFTHASTI